MNLNATTSPAEPLRILVVGMGALGQVFGAYLARGGAHVGCLVRPGQAEGARRGYHLAELRRWRRDRVMRFEPREVLTDPAQVDARWDHIWLCTHATAMRESWMAELRARAPSAIVVSIGAGVDDRATVERIWPADQVVEVFPTILAFAREAKDSAPGIAFWVLPGVRPVSGPEAQGRAVAGSLASGGLPATYVGTVPKAKLSSAFNMPMIAAEEAAGWSAWEARSHRKLALAAAGEAMAVTAAALGVPAPAPPSSFAAWKNAALFALVAPFDAAAFRRQHFTKVGPQTLQMLEGWIAEGSARGLGVERLKALRALLLKRRAVTSSTGENAS
jgi:2-dehydropantoate 2-reductase